MKNYTACPKDTLGSIARKFGVPSWKYLYQLNKEKIGNNPDLLTEGTVLKIPQWDSTGGDEKIKAKGGDPFKYTGGMRYAYPWVPFSFTIMTEDNRKAPDFDQDREVIVRNCKTNEIISKSKMRLTDSFEMLVPDSPDIRIGILGFPLEKDGIQHRHPDEEF